MGEEVLKQRQKVNAVSIQQRQLYTEKHEMSSVVVT